MSWYHGTAELHHVKVPKWLLTKRTLQWHEHFMDGVEFLENLGWEETKGYEVKCKKTVVHLKLDPKWFRRAEALTRFKTTNYKEILIQSVVRLHRMKLEEMESNPPKPKYPPMTTEEFKQFVDNNVDTPRNCGDVSAEEGLRRFREGGYKSVIGGKHPVTENEILKLLEKKKKWQDGVLLEKEPYLTFMHPDGEKRLPKEDEDFLKSIEEGS